MKINTFTLWAGHFPVTLQITHGNDGIQKKLAVSSNTMTQGAIPYHFRNEEDAIKIQSIFEENGTKLRMKKSKLSV